MNFVKIIRNVKLGLSSLRAHKLRSVLTAMGIVFGVASVICMLAIGEGLSYEAREQIRRLGSNNIIIRSVKPPKKMDDTEQQGGGMSAIQYGLTYSDIDRIESTVPGVEVIVPHRELRQDIAFHERRIEGRVIGTVPWYVRITGMRVIAGRFIGDFDMAGSANVCVVNYNTLHNLGGLFAVLGSTIKLGGDYYRVIGVLEAGMPSTGPSAREVSTSHNEVYIPLSAARQRFGETIVTRDSGAFSAERVELHGAHVRVAEGVDVLRAAKVVEALLRSSHDQADYEMIVPLQLLREKERVKRLYNIVLALMAGISLVVGGIGIMNIMLATVTERTPEIGIRRAIGARRRDIMLQFLTETTLLSGVGGVLGVVLGFLMPWAVRSMFKVATIVTPGSVVLAFSISVIVGLVFGFYPAMRAAKMNPITALRHE